MADFVFNVAKGRAAELYNRVDSNDPANSALLVVVLAASGLEGDSTLKDYATLAALLAGASNEVTNSGYARKTITDSDLSALSPDNTNDRMDIDMPDQTFTAVAAGDTWAKVLICYDNDTTGGTDANVIPLVALDCSFTPDGSDVLASINAAGFFRAA